ncbi:MAG: thiamine-phosphate kinase [Candidatus Omnitrophota bacterium]
MLIKGFGEFRLIERLKRGIKLDSEVILGSGDDCAVIKFDKENLQLFTCDMIVERVDFTLKDKPYLIGRKAVASSISDISACLGSPRHCLVSLGLPKTTSLKFVDALFKGIRDTCREYKINIIGGDLSSSNRIVIDVSMFGLVKKSNLALRSKAKLRDLIFVTGSLGGSIKGKHLNFTPRVKESLFLSKNFKINSMIDISDGLTQDLGHILRQSNKGAFIYEGLVPLSKQARGLNDALTSGEEFELLFTLSQREARRLVKSKDRRFNLIGEVVDKKYGFKLIYNSGKIKDLKQKGFSHF